MAAGLAVFAFLVYANTLGNGFVWDDLVILVNNPALRESPVHLLGSIDAVRSNDPTPYYRPLTWLTFLLEERIHGLNPVPVRTVNVLLHSVNAFLVFRLGRMLLGSPGLALLAGLLFAAHPLHAEAVDFNSSRNTLLATLFSLSAFLVHDRAVRRGRPSSAAAGALLFFAGLMSKEIALFLFPLIVFLEWEPLRSGDPVARWNSSLRLFFYGTAALLYLFLRHQALTGAGIRYELLPGLGTRLLENVYILPQYFLNIVWPVWLSPRYFIPESLESHYPMLCAAWAVMIAGLIWILTRGRGRATLVGLLWMAAFWLPASGIFPIPSAPMADRYLYAPAIGLWLIIADQYCRLGLREKSRVMIGRVAAGVVVTALVVLTVRYNTFWNNDIALFSHVIELYPDRAFGYHNLGTAYLDQVGDLDQAERAFEKALALDPAFPRLRTQLGYIRKKRGDDEGALRHYTEAVMIDPHDAEAIFNRGQVLERLGRYPEAAFEYRRFLEVPGNPFPDARPYAEERLRALAR